MTSVSGAALSQGLGKTLWPALHAHGFETRTDRIAWRHANGHTDLVEVSSVGAHADAIGATPASLSARVGSVPAWLYVSVPTRKGLPAPHYWHTPLHRTLDKTLSQPWFKPFAHSPAPTKPRSFLLHREALMRLLRRDTHDRPDVWFVLDHGSNLKEVLTDLVRVVLSGGLSLIDDFHKPDTVIKMAEAGELTARPGSPVASGIVHEARRALGQS